MLQIKVGTFLLKQVKLWSAAPKTLSKFRNNVLKCQDFTIPFFS